jgi:histidine triad (HIT) family protein
MATIFSKIAKGEIPSHKIAEDDNFYAFLDINPLAKGHTLVIPKKEIDYIFDMDDDLCGNAGFFQTGCKAIERVVLANGLELRYRT